MSKELVGETVTLPFVFGEPCVVDGDTSLIVTVIGFAFFQRGLEVKIGWFHNGDIKEAWVDQRRLSRDT